MEFHCIPALFLILLLSPFMVVFAILLGGWKPIKDVKDPDVQAIGKFTVTEYNEQSKAKLEFATVLSGETQVLTGMNYRLVVEAKNGHRSGKYEVVVWDMPWERFRELTSFKPLKNS